MISRSEAASAVRSRSLSSSRIDSAPMPPRKYTPKPYGEPKRSLSSRKSCSSLTISFGSSSRNRSQVCSRRRTESTAASRASSRRDSMSRYISRTFSDHCTIASRSSFEIFPSVRRQRSFASSRTSDSSVACSITSRSRPLPSSRARSRFLMSTSATSSLSSSARSPPPSSASITRFRCFVIAPFFDPVASASSARSDARDSRICCAAAPTFSSSRGVSLRSSRIAALRTSSRIFFESSVESEPARSPKMPLTSARDSSSVGSPCSSAQFERPRAQKSSSSSKSFSLPFAKYARRRASRCSSAASASSRSTSMRAASAVTLSSRSFRSDARFSTSTAVTIEAAKYSTFSSSRGAMSSR